MRWQFFDLDEASVDQLIKTPLADCGTGWRHGFQFEEEQKLLALFADDLRAPFSLHNFVEHGASACGKYPGEWFGPSATARCIQSVDSFI